MASPVGSIGRTSPKTNNVVVGGGGGFVGTKKLRSQSGSCHYQRQIDNNAKVVGSRVVANRWFKTAAVEESVDKTTTTTTIADGPRASSKSLHTYTSTQDHQPMGADFNWATFGAVTCSAFSSPSSSSSSSVACKELATAQSLCSWQRWLNGSSLFWSSSSQVCSNSSNKRQQSGEKRREMEKRKKKRRRKQNRGIGKEEEVDKVAPPGQMVFGSARGDSKKSGLHKTVRSGSTVIVAVNLLLLLPCLVILPIAHAANTSVVSASLNQDLLTLNSNTTTNRNSNLNSNFDSNSNSNKFNSNNNDRNRNDNKNENYNDQARSVYREAQISITTTAGHPQQAAVAMKKTSDIREELNSHRPAIPGLSAPEAASISNVQQSFRDPHLFEGFTSGETQKGTNILQSSVDQDESLSAGAQINDGLGANEEASSLDTHTNLAIKETDGEEAEDELSLSSSTSDLVEPSSSLITGNDRSTSLTMDNDDSDDYNDYGAYVIYDTGCNSSFSPSPSSSPNLNSNSNSSYPNSTLRIGPRLSSSSQSSSSGFQVIFFAAMPPYKSTGTAVGSSARSGNSGSGTVRDSITPRESYLSEVSLEQHQVSREFEEEEEEENKQRSAGGDEASVGEEQTTTSNNRASRPIENNNNDHDAQVANGSFKLEHSFHSLYDSSSTPGPAPILATTMPPTTTLLVPTNNSNWEPTNGVVARQAAQSSGSRSQIKSGLADLGGGGEAMVARHRSRRHRVAKPSSSSQSSQLHSSVITNDGDVHRKYSSHLNNASSTLSSELDEDDIKWLSKMNERSSFAFTSSSSVTSSELSFPSSLSPSSSSSVLTSSSLLSSDDEQASRSNKLDDHPSTTTTTTSTTTTTTTINHHLIASSSMLKNTLNEPNQDSNQEQYSPELLENEQQRQLSHTIDNMDLVQQRKQVYRSHNTPEAERERSGLLRVINTTTSSSRGGVDGQQDDSSSGSYRGGEQRGHNVYYWRLIWFILPLGATFGNLLVIGAVYMERSLQSVTNYFIVSLAFADLFVGLVVMPFAVYVLVNEVWELSDAICDIYVAVDVTSSTASILNLVAISIDRYRAVAHPIAYSARSSSTRAILTIFLVWLISCCVGAPIILGLNTSPERQSTLCILYNSTFIFWSSLTSFYVPCIIMIGLYWRIFLAIRSRTKKAIQAGGGANNQRGAPNNKRLKQAGTGEGGTILDQKQQQQFGSNKQHQEIILSAQLDMNPKLAIEYDVVDKSAPVAPPCGGQNIGLENTDHQGAKRWNAQNPNRGSGGGGEAEGGECRLGEWLDRSSEHRSITVLEVPADVSQVQDQREVEVVAVAKQEPGSNSSGQQQQHQLTDRSITMCPVARWANTIRRDSRNIGTFVVANFAKSKIFAQLNGVRAPPDSPPATTTTIAAAAAAAATTDSIADYNGNEEDGARKSSSSVGGSSGTKLLLEPQGDRSPIEGVTRSVTENNTSLRFALERVGWCQCDVNHTDTSDIRISSQYDMAAKLDCRSRFISKIIQYIRYTATPTSPPSPTNTFPLASRRSSSISADNIDLTSICLALLVKFSAPIDTTQSQLSQLAVDLQLTDQVFIDVKATTKRQACNLSSVEAEEETATKPSSRANDTSRQINYLQFQFQLNLLTYLHTRKEEVAAQASQAASPSKSHVSQRKAVSLIESTSFIQRQLDHCSGVELILTAKCRLMETSKPIECDNSICCICCGGAIAAAVAEKTSLEEVVNSEDQQYNNNNNNNSDHYSLRPLLPSSICLIEPLLDHCETEKCEQKDHHQHQQQELLNRITTMNLEESGAKMLESFACSYKPTNYSSAPCMVWWYSGGASIYGQTNTATMQNAPICDEPTSPVFVSAASALSSSSYRSAQSVEVELQCRRVQASPEATVSNDRPLLMPQLSKQLCGKCQQSCFICSLAHVEIPSNEVSSRLSIDGEIQRQKQQQHQHQPQQQHHHLEAMSGAGSKASCKPLMKQQHGKCEVRDFQCSHLSRLLKEEQRTKMSQTTKTGAATTIVAIDLEGGTAGGVAGSYSDDMSASEDEHSSGEGAGGGSSSGSTGFRLNSSSGSSLTGYDCSAQHDFRHSSRNSSSRRSCCQTSPTCTACERLMLASATATSTAAATDSKDFSACTLAPSDGWHRKSLSTSADNPAVKSASEQQHCKIGRGRSVGTGTTTAAASPATTYTGASIWPIKDSRKSSANCECSLATNDDSFRSHQLAPDQLCNNAHECSSQSHSIITSSFVTNTNETTTNMYMCLDSVGYAGSTEHNYDDDDDDENIAPDESKNKRSTSDPDSQHYSTHATNQQQAFGVIHNATEKIKRRSLRLSRLIRGRRNVKASTSTTKPETTNSHTISGDDPFSSSVAVQSPTIAKPKLFICTNNTQQSSVGTLKNQNAIAEGEGGSGGDESNVNTPVELNSPSLNSVKLQQTLPGNNIGQLTNQDSQNYYSKDDPKASLESNNNKGGASKQQSYLVAAVSNLMQQQQPQAKGPTKKQVAAAAAAQKVKDNNIALANRHRAGSRRRREKNAARRERKATKTLAIVLGIFLICWTPFFTCNIIDGICIQLNMDCRPGMMVYLVTSWLGYINSCVNPIIYTIFNMEFRRAFKKILTTRPSCCKR